MLAEEQKNKITLFRQSSYNLIRKNKIIFNQQSHSVNSILFYFRFHWLSSQLAKFFYISFSQNIVSLNFIFTREIAPIAIRHRYFLLHQIQLHDFHLSLYNINSYTWKNSQKIVSVSIIILRIKIQWHALIHLDERGIRGGGGGGGQGQFLIASACATHLG